MDILILVVVFLLSSLILDFHLYGHCPMSIVLRFHCSLYYCSVLWLNTGHSLYWSLSVVPTTETYVFLSLLYFVLVLTHLYSNSLRVLLRYLIDIVLYPPLRLTRYACYLGLYADRTIVLDRYIYFTRILHGYSVEH